MCASERSSRAVFASLSPPLMLMSVIRFCGLRVIRVEGRMPTSSRAPNGEPPFGGSKIPFSRRSSTLARRRRDRDRRAELQVDDPWRSPCRRTRRLLPSSRGHADSRPAASRSASSRARFGGTAVTWTLSPKMRASPARIGETAVTPGVTADRVVRLLRERVEPVLGGQRVVRDEQLVDRVAERRAQSGAQDRHERDQREADHQRRRCRRGPARVSHRVLAGERAGGAADPSAGPAEHRRERTDRPLRVHRDADEEDQRPERRAPSSRVAVVRPLPKIP